MAAVFFVAAFSACGAAGGTADGGQQTSSRGGLLGGITGKLGQGGVKPTVADPANAPDRDNTPKVLTCETGSKTFSGNGGTVDYSNIDSGYIMAKYAGSNPKIKIQITNAADKNTYTYDLTPNADFTSFPIQDSGNFTIAVFTNISGDQYSQACAQQVTAQLTDQLQPFLYPNQYCWFTDSTQAVAKGADLSKGAKSDLKVIENIFIWMTGNVKYDYDLAKNVQSGYVPDVDRTLTTKKGICFDYAALMACMLRTQNIPCKLVVGYAGQEYHAWISVYVNGQGWVYNMIQFNNDTWTFMDPTFAANGATGDPNKNDGTAYNPIYYY
ncbi:MAG: transglutaminase-like domain-containing protein [Clostridiales bacterium]|nr:transglutaminase-like domain-containing protein [Clostridiales bacterium]